MPILSFNSAIVAAVVAPGGGSGGGDSGGGSSEGITRLKPLGLLLGGAFKGCNIVPIALAYGTPNQDVIISKPPAGQRVYLVGCEGVSAVASNQRFKTATVSQDFALSANSGLAQPVSASDPGIIFATNPDESLVFNSDVALGDMMLFVIETA